MVENSADWIKENKRIVPYDRVMKTESETGVKSDKPFCWGFSVGKMNIVFTINPKKIIVLFDPNYCQILDLGQLAIQ